MKLHLPVSLFKSLLVLMSVCAVTTVQAGLMHQDVSILVYTDFGQNKGRYVTGGYANELVQYIRQQEGGIAIPYTDGSAPFYISNEQGMINFAGTGDNGAYVAIAPNVIATVQHNDTQNASFAERVVGNDHAINYSGIDIRYSSVFRLAPIQDNGNYYDYMLQRQSKIVTDAVYNPLTGEYDVNTFTGDYLYHSGGGAMCLTHGGTSHDYYCSGYQYITGGMMTITGTTYNDTNGNDSIISDAQYATGRGADEGNPLPNGLQGGDSGSPVFVYNTETKQYEYVAAMQSGSTNREGLGGRGWNQARVNVKWTHEALNSFNASVGMGADCTVVHLNAITTEGKTESDGTNSGKIYSGVVTDEADNQIVSYNGVLSGLNTWDRLNDLKDAQNWYAYDSEAYLQRGDTELFFNNNLVFSSSAANNRIVLKDTVDLGIGYAEFSGGKFSIVSEMKTEEGQQVSEGNLFNHAGYVIHEGAEVHLKLVNPEEYMTEWRKTGAGALYIDGSGNTNALLNVGGSGTTYLQQTGGYAAYNVLASSGATVEIADTDQIKRDFTFGAGGGVLNMNGKTMVWNNDNGADDAGFTIHALDELAMVANLTRGTTATLTWTQGDSQTFLGSFLDNGKDSSLQFVYEGGEGARLTMHGIRTKLTAPGSGITVNSGTLVLAGSLTEHAKGSATGRNGERLVRENDWHYADATTQVAVNDGGTFELGSHARLVGDVTVAEGGTYVMREGVAHAAEYVEGGMMLEATSQYAGYYGHKGDVVLNGGKLDILFNDGVDTNTTYAGDISGRGDITVDTGNDGGSLTLSGTVSATGKKSVTGGTLLLTGAAATDNGSGKWLVESGGQMSLDNVDLIDVASTGTLVLSRDTAAYVDHSHHSQMLLGAEAGKEVQYGAAGTTETLCDWNLGGAGTLVVNYVVSGSETLTVDGRGGNSGVVRLQQIADTYAGTINVQSEGGRMVLDIVDAELKTTVNVKEGGVLRASGGSISGSAGKVELYGAMEYDSFIVRDGATLNLRAGGRLDADNAVTIGQGGIMRLNRYTLADKVNLENGGTMYGNGGTIGVTAEVLATEGTGKLNAGNGTFYINGSIGAAEGATLRLENGTFNVSHGSLNANGGTLELACSTINLSYLLNNCTQTIGGTLSIDSNLTMYVEQGNPYKYNGIVHSINHLHINSGYKLSIVESKQDWRHVFHVSSLTGEGEILWKAENRWFAHTAMGPSRMILTGDNEFEGTLIVQQLDDHGSMQHVSLAHDNAAKNMVINLWGDSNSQPALAISTLNAHVAGIGGTENTFVYAGAVKTSGDGNDPVSTALNTLTINTAGVDHVYNGTLLGDATNGLNMVKTGEGTQTFTNAANVVHDISALQGHLNFTNAPTVHGDVSIAQGAELTIGSGASYTLNSGHTLSVLAGASGEQAVLNNELVLNGGSLYFEAYANSAGNAALSISGVSGTGATSVSFGNAGAIQLNTTQWLANGDWSELGTHLTVSTPEYMNATLSAGTQGLSAVFSMKDGYYHWGDTGSQPGAGDTVVFIGGNGAEIAGAFKHGTGLFDSETTYTVSGGTLTLDTMIKSNRGDLVLNAAVAADTLIVKEAATITGNGSLSTETLTVEADMITGLSVQAADIQGNKHTWTLDGSENRFTQQATVSQINSFSQVSVTGQAELELATDVDATLNIAINGDGSFSKGGAGKLTTTEEVQIGTLNVDAGAYEAQGRVDIDTLSVAAEAEVTMYNSTEDAGAKKHLGTIELGTGAVFQTNDRAAVTAATSVGDLSLTGTAATLRDQYHSGFYNIGSLSLGEGLTTATLDIVKKADSTYATVVNLGNANSTAGNFKGSIALSSSTGETGDAKRSLFLVLGESQAAAGASINMKAADSSTAILGLGINTASATIAGLESSSALSNRAKVFSGDIGTKVQWGSDLASAPGTVGKEVRSLTIDTASGCNYVFYGEVMENLNLVKEGAGTQELAGSSANFNGSIRVENGTLKLGSNALGMLEKASSVVVNGGRLDLSAAGSSANLTYVSGEGAVVLQYDLKGNGTAFDFSTFGGVVELAEGRIQLNTSTFGEECPDFLLTSSNSQLVFNGKSTVVNSNVHVAADSTDFHVNYDCSGTIGGDITGNSLVKHGDGSLTVGGNMKLDSMLSTYRGQVILTGAENSIANVDGAMQNGNTAAGTLRLAKDARLEVTGNIWSRSNTGIYLDSGAVLDISGKSLSIANRAEEGTASLAATTATGPGAYAIDRTDYQISNAHVTYTGGDATVRNKLTNAAIENAGSGVLKVWNDANSLTGVQATKGEIRLFDQAEHQLNHLEVAEGLKVSAYTGEKAEKYAALHVSGLAEFGSGATLNADMVLQSGAVLDMGGKVMLDGVLTLQAGLKLDGAVLDAVQGLAVGESHILFTGVDGLKVQSLQQAVTLYNMRSLAEQTNDAVSYSALMDGGQVAAADYFSNLFGNTGLVLSYNGTAGTVTITNTQAVPEPTSTTLSLLALAGLCARRRRR